ncbi:hypothetical protein LX36DRAFT_137284 [Colletotrichum falcatum]|nr:hypothetical protein LX36DRAFT_137284 [Colletotrichum falcatum]
MGMFGAPALSFPGALSLATNVSSAAVRIARRVFTAWGWLPPQSPPVLAGSAKRVSCARQGLLSVCFIQNSSFLEPTGRRSS